ncbi:MAG: hypothetical protein AB2L11_06895 [Syntrophobacteraceae bacterium]
MDFFLHPYFIIGYIVAIFNLKKLAKSLENSSTGFMSGHPVSVSTGKNQEPGIITYICAVAWSCTLIIPAWPAVILYYLIIANDK